MTRILPALGVVLSVAAPCSVLGAYSLHGTNDTAAVFEDQPGHPFSWYRFTIKQVWGKGSQTGVNVAELGLFDARGTRQNVGLTVKDSGTQSSLVPGEMCWDSTAYKSTASGRGLEMIADDNSATHVYGSGSTLPQLEKESSWLSLTMRLASGKNPVASYDAIPVYDAYNGRTLQGYSLMGSVDGQVWFPLDEQRDRPYATDGTSMWQSDSSTFETGALHQGYPVASHESGTYVLSGDGASGVLEDVDNGRYCRLSIVKNGEGIWTLGGRQTFTGDLIVNAGTLRLEPFRKPYTWFKLVIRQASTKGTDNCVSVGELGLFDKNGHRQNCKMNISPAGRNASLEPGCACLNWSWPTASGRGLDKAYDEVAGDIGDCLLLMPSKHVDPDADGTWITIVMRLASGAKPIASYDVLPIGWNNGARGIMGYELWGSTSIDSSNWATGWDLLDSESNRKCDVTKWQSNQDDFVAGAAHTGYSIASSPEDAEVCDFLESAASIRVASGARLEALSPMPLNRLTLDESGNGTYVGFDFAEAGVVEVADKKAKSCPIAFENCTGTENLVDWTIMCKGEVVKDRWISRAANGLRVCANGLAIIVK